MVNIKILLPDLKKLVGDLAEDLLARATENTQIDTGLREAFNQIEKGGRTAQAFEVWREDYLDQVAVAWVLACVFVRFMEDNHLIDECWLAGEKDRRKLAEDSHELFFRQHPHDTDREFFQHVFKEVGKIPAAKDLFAEGKTPLWAVAPSGDAARNLLKFWREINPEVGHLKRSFEVENGDTRFLGDLYQELSERAKKKFALLQTPVFVEEFILDRTLKPALAEFGLEKVRMIDPTCGSGHFLLGGFARLFDLWSKPDHTTGNAEKDVQKALDGVWGVDINPFAVAIARFRLIVAAVQTCGIKRLKQAPGWNIHLASGDSLLFGSKPSFGGERVGIAQQRNLFEVPDIFAVEDRKLLQQILSQGYHVVVGNPPYITVKDKAQSEAYRGLYSTCHRQYSLGVPFTQRFWELAIQSEEANGECGYIGEITSNSFMKREFGKKLIEEFFPKIDLTHVIDTSGASIPGHGTPTVILFGRNRKPTSGTVRAVLGIKGEAGTPENASQGFVWQSIVRHIGIAHAQDDYTSTEDVPRSAFSSHPWSIGGGGVTDLLDLLNSGEHSLGDLGTVGIASWAGLDEVFTCDESEAARKRFELQTVRPFITGDVVRDWSITPVTHISAPYDKYGVLLPQAEVSNCAKYWWCSRSHLLSRVLIGGDTFADKEAPYYGWVRWIGNRYTFRFRIVFAFVATHNHFALDRGGNVFNRHAPILTLTADASEDDHIALLGLLNSSTACFWMKQVMTGKHKGDGGEAHADPAYQRFEFAGTQMQNLPVPECKPLLLSRRLDEIARQLGDMATNRILERKAKGEDLKALIEEAEAKTGHLRGLMIALQEELDWECYQHYGLVPDDLHYTGDDLPNLSLGQRAFEILMARQMAKGELGTAWFERHGSTPITEIPANWPAAYRKLAERRIKLIETNKEIALIERPEYKRRWNSESWEEQEQRALKNWLLDRLETPEYRKGTKEHLELTTTAQMADVASADAEFLQVAALHRGRSDFDVVALIADLVESEAVPFLPSLRYKPAGLRKREVWERTWELQRQQDAGKGVGEIPVPPRYATADFLKTDFWRLRGKLDVPKERWISYPHCSTDSDPSLVIGWAGWNHLQQATALVAYYDARKREGWDAKRVTPLLAGVDQLLPWIHQWHPEIDPEFGETAGQSFQTMLQQDAHELGLTLDDIRNWQPPAKATKAKAGRKKVNAEADE